MKAPSAKRFTLIEILTVIMIIGILVALLMPGVHRSRERGQGIMCMGNTRQLSIAYTQYTKSHDFYFPGADSGRSPTDWVAGGDSPDSIQDGTLFPYVDDLAVYRCPKDYRWNDTKTVRSDYFYRAYSINAFLNGERVHDPQGVNKWTKVQNGFDSVFVFVEEQDPRGFNVNSFFLQWPTHDLRTWTNADWMAPLHLQGYNLTFLDGHVQYIKTVDPWSLHAALHKGVTVPPSNFDRQQLWKHHLPK